MEAGRQPAGPGRAGRRHDGGRAGAVTDDGEVVLQVDGPPAASRTLLLAEVVRATVQVEFTRPDAAGTDPDGDDPDGDDLDAAGTDPDGDDPDNERDDA